MNTTWTAWSSWTNWYFYNGYYHSRCQRYRLRQCPGSDPKYSTCSQCPGNDPNITKSAQYGGERDCEGNYYEYQDPVPNTASACLCNLIYKKQATEFVIN